MATSFITPRNYLHDQLDEAEKQGNHQTRPSLSADSKIKTPSSGDHHVVIIGGGFGGLQAARIPGNVEGVSVTLVEKRNFHLFQPLISSL